MAPPQTRSERLDSLGHERFDVLILGGGINGAGIARDLALRAGTAKQPLRIALIDKGHFSSGTSGKNSQLIHGGLRYLKYLEFRLVREALRERATLLKIAPHLVQPLPFLIPMYSQFAKYFYGSGLWLYDMLAGSRNISPHRAVEKQELARIEPGLNQENLVSAALFYDCRVHSARFTLENLHDAEDHGAVLGNYVRAARFESGEGWTVHCEDLIGQREVRIRARLLINTTGPWAGEVYPIENQLRLVRGSHLVFPRLNRSDNAIAYFEKNGRIIFFIPWGSQGQLTLVGTTDVDHDGSADAVHISDEESQYLRKIAADLYPESRGMDPVASYSSLRPLVKDASGSATATSREHRIWRDAQGVIHVAGGKYTTYRSMSEEAADLACEAIAPGLRKIHETAERALPDTNLPADPVGLAREAVRREWVQRLPDLLQVSTYLGYEQKWTWESLLPWASALGQELGWDRQRTEMEADTILASRK